MPPSRFRLQAKNFFLTYPRCSISKQDLLTHVLSLSFTSRIAFIRVCKELHEDGEPHLHVLLQLQGKMQITNPRFFDITNPSSSTVFHPNVQCAKSSTDINAYIAKENDFIDHGQFQIDGRSARGGCQTANDAYAAALNTNCPIKALDHLRQTQPRDYILNYHNIKSNLSSIFSLPLPPFISSFLSSSFLVPSDIIRWMDLCFLNSAARPIINNSNIRPLSLIIEGPSRTGKTQWARSLGVQPFYLNILK